MTTKKSKVQITARNLATTYELPLINSNNELLADGRLLHEKLKSRQQFANWIANRIKDYGFVEGKDFLINLLKSTGGRKATDYHLTLDMAKELCMVERSEIGRSFRRYFIEAEKELRTKRLYAAQATITAISKNIKPVTLNGRKLYPLREVRTALGFSAKSSTGGIRKQYDGLVVLWDNRLYVAEEYVRIIMSRAKTRALQQEAKASKPVLPDNFGQLPINFTAKKGGSRA